jgi:para-aminobenzoate synthetase component I
MDTGAPLSFDAIPVSTPPGGPLAVELVPAPDPWHVARKLSHLPHILFLDSAEQHATRGRYSYVAAGGTLHPYHTADAPWRSGSLTPPREEFERCGRGTTIPGLPPFQGGLAGLFGYELGAEFDRQPIPRTNDFGIPDVAIELYPWVVSFDHLQRRAWVVSSGRTGGPEEVHARVAEAHLSRTLSCLRVGQHWPGYVLPLPSDDPEHCISPDDLASKYPLPGFPDVTSNFDRDGYEAAVRRAVEYVHAGDCFQVNLSQRLLAPLREHPLDLYGRLRTLNPAPFAAYFDLGDFQILSASPERFLRVYPDGEVETRPIKGTRPRGATPEEDAAMIRDLALSPKDRAENVMIVDLLRNDIGKVCEYGSVRVPRVCEVETFRFVHHLVSEVRGKLRSGLGPLDLLAAAFPGGSVTGAPKVRAMEIIAELEPTARGPYCGCLGWVGFDGAMDTNILIRTFTAGRGWVQFPVGGGIVADSDPAREYEETLHKAAGLLQAL